jgi:DNA modification methylase
MSAPLVFLDNRVTLYLGDVLAVLATLPDESVDCVVTSPPYWGLRDYGVEGQIGLERTLGEHLDVMLAVFREIRRVLKKTGTCWVNYGDCYATSPNGRSAADTKAAGSDDRTFRDKPFSTVGGVFKAKDLCMIPNRLAIALQEDGWWVRQEIIWGKTNPMPDSSGTSRPSTSHEKIFLLGKSDAGGVWRARDTGEVSFNPDLSERCPLVTDPDREAARWIEMDFYYDARAVRQGRTSDEDSPTFRGGSYVGGAPGPRTVTGNVRVKMPDGWDTGAGGHGSRHRSGREKGKTKVRASDVASTRHRGHINHTGIEALARGEGRLLRNYEPAPVAVWPIATESFSEAHFATFPTELAQRCILAGCPKGGLVLDPFGGAGTTALVAVRHSRRAALIELNPEYAAIARRRIEAEWKVPVLPPQATDFGPLFSIQEAAE